MTSKHGDRTFSNTKAKNDVTWSRLAARIEGSRYVLEQHKSRANGIVDTLYTIVVNKHAEPSSLTWRKRSAVNCNRNHGLGGR